jgi:putative hemolysin
MLSIVLILGACLLWEGFFSGAELALISADQVRLRHHAKKVGGTRGRLILKFLDDPGQLISTSLVGTNICVVLSVVVTTLTLLPLYPDHAELLSLGVMTPLILVFGEIVPKSLFQHFANRLAPTLIWVLSGFRLLFFPFVILGTALSTVLIRSLKLDARKSVMSREELRLLIQLPSRQGKEKITANEKQMITRIFDFRETTVEDVMLPLSEVTALPIDATLADAAQEVVEKQHTRLPVYRDRIDNIEGIVHAFDLLRAESSQQVADLSRQAIFVPESQLAVDTLVRLQREGQGMAVVVDEYGGATGVVTIEDIVEEVVGEIEDEYDNKGPELIRRDIDGSYLVQGRTPVERLNESLNIEIPLSDEYETLAGFVLETLKRIPSTGNEMVAGGAKIVVTRSSDRAIDELRVIPLIRKKR